MDRHVRWFRREVAVGVARRLTAEALAAAALTLGGLLIAEVDVVVAVIAALVVLPFVAAARFAIACTANPMNSSFLIRWPHPSGESHPIAQTNTDSDDDLALRSFAFTCKGAFEEWGGARTNVYTRDSNQIVVTTSDDGDLVAMSGLDDGRLVLSTKQLIPPHERLVVNQRHETDVRSVLMSHIELMKTLTADGRTITTVGFSQVLELLAIEWDAWDQVGPLIGPFVAVGHRRTPTVLQVRVPAADVLERTSAPAPRITAHPLATTVAPQLPGDTTDAASPVPSPPPIPSTIVVPPPVHVFPHANIEAAS